MNDFSLLSMILFMGIFFGAIANWAMKSMFTHIDKIKAIMANNRAFKAKQDAVDAMRAAGDFHEWINVQTPAGLLMVCKKTGFAPSLKGFIPMANLNSYLEKMKYEEEYKVFRNARVQLLAHELQRSIPETENFVEKVFSMKKDFHVLKLAQLQEELKKKAAHVESEQTKV